MFRLDTLTLSELARRTGVSPRAIRYYLTTGLLRRPPKQGRELLFQREDVLRLQAIRHLQRNGLSLEAIGRQLERTPPERLERIGRGHAPPMAALRPGESAPMNQGLRLGRTGALPEHLSSYQPAAEGESWMRVTISPRVELSYDATLRSGVKAALREIVAFARHRLDRVTEDESGADT